MVDEEYNPTITLRQADGWLSPEGDFYACGYGEHGRCARHIIGDTYARWGAVDYLEMHGWIHISEREITNSNVIPTQKQQDALFDMQMLNPASRLARSIAYFLGEENW